MKAIVSEKGQVTIPKALRRRLGIETGSVLEFEEEEGHLVAKKQLPEDPLERWRGRSRKLPVGASVDEYIAAVRER